MLLSSSFYQFLLLANAFFILPTRAFLPLSTTTTSKIRTSQPNDLVTLAMSSSPMNDKEGHLLGETERLLLQKAYERDNGLVQEYGRTIKKDGLDSVRAAVWGLFYASQAVFSVLAVALVFGMALNVAGYAYYWDDAGFHIDSLQYVSQMRFLEEETARLAATTAEQLR